MARKGREKAWNERQRGAPGRRDERFDALTSRRLRAKDGAGEVHMTYPCGAPAFGLSATVTDAPMLRDLDYATIEAIVMAHAFKHLTSVELRDAVAAPSAFTMFVGDVPQPALPRYGEEPLNETTFAMVKHAADRLDTAGEPLPHSARFHPDLGGRRRGKMRFPLFRGDLSSEDYARIQREMFGDIPAPKEMAIDLAALARRHGLVVVMVRRQGDEAPEYLGWCTVEEYEAAVPKLVDNYESKVKPGLHSTFILEDETEPAT